ncbi:NAD(P)H-hydrate dehydratase [Ramlibacter sp. WS9]|uniref:NAD(P)H-hydrate dehydratase n=1 Tax=Ramlibacter sp. WS9 TaxID=1882741 RepID=UPI0011416B23|nr:NAD(P)H-hydrate dehydratase [Ramlibacter sp. WS9]ROZ76958.1 NAD(P)H-hydrate dehydratase [Ramlibacter sp. WS9]
MQRVTTHQPWPLFDVAATRAIESAAAASLPPHTLMQRAGLAVARLALALAPNAKTIWIACGPGNNGGDGFEAAMHLQGWGKQAVVTWLGDEAKAPADALASLKRARDAGVLFASEPPAHWDLAIDALLGLGGARAMDGAMAQWAALMSAAPAPVLAVDLPSGLGADTGAGHTVRATHTLALLVLKPGLFTAAGRDASGQVWLDDLGVGHGEQTPTAWLAGPPAVPVRAHASHKGSYGDVGVVGGGPGMTGAALLAASAALHDGAGRVFVSLLDGMGLAIDPPQPELMLRPWDSLDLAHMAVACGCGGGDSIRAVLPKVLSSADSLVLDADALNAIAADMQLQSLLQARARRQKATVLTPHPLEAARLLGCDTTHVQGDRLRASRDLAQRFACVVVLKGSGTVIAAPGSAPLINPTGNARLATAGTGDVLAGMIAARLAAGASAMDAAAGAVYAHGLAADRWPAGEPLTASALARR